MLSLMTGIQGGLCAGADRPGKLCSRQYLADGLLLRTETIDKVDGRNAIQWLSVDESAPPDPWDRDTHLMTAAEQCVSAARLLSIPTTC